MFYLINKEKGISSFKSIKNFANNNNIKKIGHTGTLDPMATGLLLVATEEDTKLIEYIDKGFKSYIVTLELGKTSNTYDSEGKINITNFIWDPNKVEEIIKSYIKTYNQQPPIFSAKKINGSRAYELARKGKEVILKKNKVTINSIKNIKKINNYTYEFEIEVSRGTYIRSIVNEIGIDLKCGAIMTSLIRNKIAGFTLKDKGQVDVNKLIHLPRWEVKNIKNFMDGKTIELKKENGLFLVLFKKQIIGIINIKENKINSRKIFGKKVERILNESNKIS